MNDPARRKLVTMHFAATDNEPTAIVDLII